MPTQTKRQNLRPIAGQNRRQDSGQEPQQNHRIVADFGATHVRIAIAHGPHLLDSPQVFATADVDDSAAWFAEFVAKDSAVIHSLRAAVAGPVDNQDVTLTNLGLRLNAQDIANKTGIKDVRLLNDAHAAVLGTRVLPKQTCEMLHAGEPVGDQVALLAVGTGLGVAGRIGKDTVVSGEGGHIALPPPRDPDLAAVWQILRGEYSRVSAERIISGAGLFEVAEVHARLAGEPFAHADGKQVMRAALEGRCRHAHAAALGLLESLGVAAASVALVLGARRGVYLAGGMMTRLRPLIASSRLREAFHIGGRMENYISKIPLILVDEPFLALRGCAVAR
ncbi:MAG: glucokinase [Pseudomonadota bacterium]